MEFPRPNVMHEASRASLESTLQAWRETHDISEVAEITRDQKAIDPTALESAIREYIQRGDVEGLVAFAKKNVDPAVEDEVGSHSGALAVGDVLGKLGLPVPGEIHMLNNQQNAQKRSSIA